MLSAEAARYVGASDLPALLGLSRYAEPVTVWERIVHGRQEPGGVAAEWGSLTEQACARIGVREIWGREVEGHKPPSRLGIETAPEMRYSLDWVTLDPAGIYECKLREYSSWKEQGWGRDWTDEVPVDILVQVQAQIELARRDWRYWDAQGLDVEAIDGIWVLCHVGAFSLHAYRVERDPEIGAHLIDVVAREFWRFVSRKVPPPVGATLAGRDWVERAHHGGPAREATAEEVELAITISELAREQKQLREQAVGLENRLRELVGDTDEVALPRGQIRLSRVQGRVSTRTVIDELAGQLGLSRAQVREIEERHRGEGGVRMVVRGGDSD